MKEVVFLTDHDVRLNHSIALGLVGELQAHAAWQMTLLDLFADSRYFKDRLRSRRPDAVVTHTTEPDQSWLTALRSSALPWIEVRVDSFPQEAIPVVVPDKEAVGKLAAEHLLESRFEHFGIVAEYSGSLARSEFQGFREGIGRAGRTTAEFLMRQPNLRLGHLGFLSGMKTDRLWHWLRGLPKPCAVFGTDEAAAHVINACHLHHIDIPEEVSVIGMGDDRLICKAVYPNLSSVHVPYRQIGVEAARLIRDWCPGRRVITVPPTSVTERQSVRPPRLGDALVQKAMEHLRANVQNGVRASDLQKLTGLSPSELTRRFHRALQYSPMDAILRQRIHLAKQQLEGTDEPIGTIARTCGFNSPNQFYVAFRNQLGMSPGQYRKTHAI